jgi:hypothetical protein
MSESTTRALLGDPTTGAAQAPSVPIIYCRPPAEPDLPLVTRGLFLLLAAGCLSLLVTAAALQPSPEGVATHTNLGFARCTFLDRTGLPCPSCGMTTSFAWFVRGNVLASLYVQPMGFVLACLTAITFWVALYLAITGKPALRLLSRTPAQYYLLPLLGFAIVAWAWKIFIHVRGIDGWH